MGLFTAFTPVFQFPASAGIGEFNASFSNDYPPGVFAFDFYYSVSQLFTNADTSYDINPVANGCSGIGCQGVFLVAGVAGISPSPALRTQSPEADTIIVQGEQGLQADFWNVSPAEDPLTSQDCQTWGDIEYAFMICSKSSSLDPNNLIAGINTSWHRH